MPPVYQRLQGRAPGLGGGGTCEYHVRWTPPDISTRLVGAVSALVAVGIALGWGLGWLGTGALAGIPTVLAVAAAYAAWSFYRQYQRSASNAGQYFDASRRRLEEEYRRYRDLVTLNRIDGLTRKHLEVPRLLETVLDEITRTLGYDRAFFMAVDEDRGILRTTHSVGYSAEQLELLRQWTAPLDHESEDERFLANVVKRREGTLVTDMEAYRAAVSTETEHLLDALGTEAFLAMPVVVGEGDVQGLLIVEQTGSGEGLADQDRTLLGQLCHHLGLALSNARKVAKLQSMLMVNQKLSLYLDASVVAPLLENPREALSLGGETRQGTVLFSDIVGFTLWSEGKDPQTVVAKLNLYFEAMDTIIAGTGGILDKRMGDGMLVVFLHPDGSTTDAPEATLDDSAPPPRHPAWRALDCALRMQKAAAMLATTAGDGGFPDLKVRIGVAHGQLVSGNIGSTRRFEHTVIGDTVNVASRLESDCPPGGVLTNAETRARIPDAPFGFETHETKSLKGRKGIVEQLLVSMPGQG